MNIFYTSLTLQDEYQALQLALTTAETSLSSVKRENDTLVVQLMALKVFFIAWVWGIFRGEGPEVLCGKKDKLNKKGKSFNFCWYLKGEILINIHTRFILITQKF